MLAATKVKMSGSEKKVTGTRLRHFVHKTCNLDVSGSFKAILHETILNDDFSRKPFETMSQQCCNAVLR